MRSFNNIVQVCWPFLSKISYGLEKPELIPRGGSTGVGNPSEIDDNDTNPSECSGNDTGNIGAHEPSNVDDIRAWDSANEH